MGSAPTEDETETKGGPATCGARCRTTHCSLWEQKINPSCREVVTLETEAEQNLRTPKWGEPATNLLYL